MPSQSYRTYDTKLLKDVRALISTHKKLSSSEYEGRGRRHLGHITRSICIFLCAAWERYMEDVLLESLEILCREIQTHSELPKQIRIHVSRKLKASKNNISPFQLAGNDWKSTIQNMAREDTENLHTPKSSNLDTLFKQYLGIDEIHHAWTISDEKEEQYKQKIDIDDFISARGDIAHNGSSAKYPRIDRVKGTLFPLINETVRNVDNYLATYLKELTGKSPWKRKL